MRPTGPLVHLAICLSSLSPLAAAWPGWLPDLDAIVVRRADSTTTSAAASSTDSSNSAVTTANLNTASVETGTDTATSTGTATGTATGKTTGTATGTSKKTTDKSSKATHTSFSAADPVASVNLQTPVTTVQATPLYKIGDMVTFGWNYTSLQGTPTAIDVLISATSSQTWTLTQNMTFATKVSYVWDTNKDGDVAHTPLAVQLYTLIVKDSDASISDTADPGYLGTYSGLKFGLYTGQPYTPLPDWTCVGCNAALSQSETHALSFVVTMSVITVATFTWFVTGLGLH